MSAGYVQGTNNGTICFLSPGPGMANAVNGLNEAYHTRSPILVITASAKNTIQADKSKLFHGLDHAGVFKPVVNEYIYLDDKVKFSDQLEYVFTQIFINKTGPILLELDLALLSADIIPATQLRAGLQTPAISKLKDYESDIPDYERIKNKRRGVMLVGRKTALYNCSMAVSALADASGFPIIMTTAGKGAIDETQEFYFDSIKEKRAFDLIAGSEIVLFIGVDLNEIDTWNWSLSVKGIAVSVFSDLNYKIDCEVLYVIPGNSLKDSLATLRDNCYPGQKRLPPENFNHPLIREIRNEYHRVFAESMHGDVSIVNDVHLTGFGLECVIRSKHPCSLLYSHLAFNLGYGLPVAIGLKLARPEQRVVLFCGDGGFLISSPELATLLANDIRILIVLINDFSYGTIKRKQLLAFDAVVGSTLSNPDFGKLADSYNIGSVQVTDLSDFSIHYQRELKTDRTFLIEYLKQKE